PNILIAGSLPAVNLSRQSGTEFWRAPRPALAGALSVKVEPHTNRLALAELEALAGALLPVLFAFLHARITRQKPVFAQARAQFRLEDRQRAGKPHAQGARRSTHAATVHGCNN